MSLVRIAGAALLAGAIAAGCASSPPGEAPRVVRGSEKALDGAVIIKTDGTYVYYRRKCGSCGHVSNRSYRLAAPAKGKAVVSAFMCEKCHKPQRVLIKSQ